MKKCMRIWALLFSFMLVFPVYGQGLPQLPLPKDDATPPLSMDEMVPEKTVPKKGVLGEDRNAVEKKKATLDKQFIALKRTADVHEAAKVSSRIQGLWEQSGSETVDLLMQWAAAAIHEGDYAKAMDFLDNVVMLEPGFAEGWMRRARVHMQTNDLALSMFDLSHVLKLEPRHYNAFVLIGMIMEATGRNQRAIEAYDQALEIYPQMARVQQRLADLLEKETDRAL